MKNRESSVLKFARWLLPLCFLLACLGVLAAQPLPTSKGPRLLVLYKSSESPSPDQSEVKSHIEPVLKKLGFAVDYFDVNQALPDAARMKSYQAILTWHRTAQYANPQAYIRFVRDQVLAGRKVVVLGNFGAHTADLKTWASNESLNEFFVPFGLEYRAGYSGDASKLQVVTDSAVAKSPNPPPTYMNFHSKAPSNRSYLVIRRTDLPDSDSALVVRTPKGGMAQEGYLYKTEGGNVTWLLDREQFLSEVLDVKPRVASSKGGRILGLYKGSDGQNGESNYISRFCREPLKALGYQLDCQDVEKGFPDSATMQGYSGVISWYQSAAMAHAADYCRWLTQQIQAGRKVVILGTLGAFQELDKSGSVSTERWLLPHEYNSFLYPFGLEFLGMWTKDTAKLKAVSVDPRMVPWIEPAQLAHYFWIRSANPDNKVYLKVGRTDVPYADSAFVVRTPYGGYVLESYLFRDVTGRGDYKWHFALKDFLDDCLNTKAKNPPANLTYQVKPSNPPLAPAEQQLPQPPPLPAGAPNMKRKILAFIQRDFKETTDQNSIGEVVESILNHLGLIIEYRFIEDPLPTEQEMQEYRGIITWFHGNAIANAQAYANWLKGQMDNGKLYVILGDYGAYQDSAFKSQVSTSEVMKTLGVDYRPNPTEFDEFRRRNPGLDAFSGGSIEHMDINVCKFERDINLNDPDLKLRGWPIYLSIDPKSKVYLSVKDGRGKSDVLLTTPRGGLAVGQFIMYTPPNSAIRKESSQPASKDGLATGPAAEENDLQQWRFDPFKFFSEAFQVKDLPSADVTTLNGSRIYFSHIDGDASFGMSLIDRASLNHEMMYREILAPTQLPVTVSFVTNNLEKKATSTYTREINAARQIFALPWVELATHTDIHPFNWRDGDLTRVTEPGGDFHLVKVPPDYKKEVYHSIDFTNQVLAPPGKKCTTLLWSGLCNPPQIALEMTDSIGVCNMNGGDPIYDSTNPFVAGVANLYKKVGNRYQYHTCAAGDFYYTSSWTRDYDGMKRLPEFFKYTEEPRRLRAMNLYYHFYLAERELGIQGLRSAMEYVKTQRPAPMFVSNYVAIVKDMITTKIGRSSDGAFVVTNSGACRTIRWDNMPQDPDLSRCSGVIGFYRMGQRLYVHLDESKTHKIILGSAKGNSVYLERASHYVNSFKVAAGNSVTFRMHGVGPGHFTLANMPAGTYRVNVSTCGESRVAAGVDGKLTWSGTLLTYEGDYKVTISR